MRKKISIIITIVCVICIVVIVALDIKQKNSETDSKGSAYVVEQQNV